MPPSPLVIALTGSIGSGKSTVGDLLRRLGVTVLDADILAREVVQVGQPALKQIAATFGESVITRGTGELNRKALGRIVFAERARLRELEAILHPEIRALFQKKLSELKRHELPPPWIITYLIPLLFEASSERETHYSEFDLTVTVSATRDACVERVVNRDLCSQSDAEAKISAQLPTEEKERHSTLVVHNNGSLLELQEEVNRLHAKLAEAFEAKQSSKTLK